MNPDFLVDPDTVSLPAHFFKYDGKDLIINVDYDSDPQDTYKYDEVRDVFVLESACEDTSDTQKSFDVLSERAFIQTDRLMKRLNDLDVEKIKSSRKLCLQLEVIFRQFNIRRELLKTPIYGSSNVITFKALSEIKVSQYDDIVKYETMLNDVLNYVLDEEVIIDNKDEKSKLVKLRESAVQKILNLLTHFDEKLKEMMLTRLKTTGTPEKLLQFFTIIFISVKRYEVVRNYVVKLLSKKEKEKFTNTTSLEDFMSKLGSVADEEALTEFNQNVMPLSDIRQLKHDYYSHRSSQKEKADFFIKSLEDTSEIFRDCQSKHDLATIAMLYRSERMSRLFQVGRYFTGISPTLSETNFSDLVKEGTKLNFVKENSENMGLDLIDKMLKSENLILAEAERRDEEALRSRNNFKRKRVYEG